ncbi:hypothetical protein PIB30_084567 [Stylosanthes scabra]|uniref:PB1-like domain-containing protein n=1 Tax=Stylosanthes scabra TaxID=79078 RepID=A0ABU6XQE4_9FABA|nr:hypothetical protein [Stylosanthes scabra]
MSLHRRAQTLSTPPSSPPCRAQTLSLYASIESPSLSPNVIMTLAAFLELNDRCKQSHPFSLSFVGAAATILHRQLLLFSFLTSRHYESYREEHSSPSHHAAATISLKLELPSLILEVEMASLITLVYHHMGRGVVTDIDGVRVRVSNGLRLLEMDEDVVNMCDVALNNGNRAHLYLENPVIADPIVIEQVVVSDDTHKADVEIA